MRASKYPVKRATLVYLASLALWIGCNDPGSKRQTNDPCINNTDCADQICHLGICASATPRGSGGACNGPGDCRSFNCVNRLCVAGSKQGGQPCLHHEECASKSCQSKKCVAKSAPDAGDAGPGDSGPGDAGPADTTKTQDGTGKDQGTPDQASVDGGSSDAAAGSPKVLPVNGFSITSASGDQRFPALAHDSKNFLVVWQDGRGSDQDVYARRVSPSGGLLGSGDFFISKDGDNQEVPAVAFDGANHLVVWQDGTGASKTIAGRQVKPDDTLLGAASIKFPLASTGWAAAYPAVVYGGSQFLVVWSDDDIVGVRVSTGGKVKETSAFSITTALAHQGKPTAAFDGVNYLVAWDDHRNTTASPDVFSSRVSAGGKVLTPKDVDVSQLPSAYSVAPAAAFDGTNYLVVWADQRGGNENIYGARISPAGKVVTLGIAISTAIGDQGYPAVAFDGTRYLVVWQDKRGTTLEDIHCGRVDKAGKVLDKAGVVLTTDAKAQMRPAVTFDGSGTFLVVWQDARNKDIDIYGTRVQP